MTRGSNRRGIGPICGPLRVREKRAPWDGKHRIERIKSPKKLLWDEKHRIDKWSGRMESGEVRYRCGGERIRPDRRMD
ncbi:hypothetical protein [Paenibacillus sp. sgz302251]|uniref:hypothetical protein n=1 Tax=Paenibacillus sp. sgz302251 TaxID=3414493 RepID=UPI003C7AFBA6